MSTAKWRNGSKSFLACSVPNLELDVLSFDIHLETPTRCVGKHFPQPPHHFLHPEAPHISMSKLHLFWGQTKAGSWKIQRLTIEMRIDASQVAPMVMSLAGHHLTHSKHTTTRRVRFSTCTKICLMKSCTTFSLQDHALQVLNLHLPPTSRPSHMFCSKAFICKLQQQTGLSNSSISNLFAQLMRKSSMRHVSLGSIGHVGIWDVFRDTKSQVSEPFWEWWFLFHLAGWRILRSKLINLRSFAFIQYALHPVTHFPLAKRDG